MANHSDEIWVFLSHSNEDFARVRKLRNLLEDNGFRPIMLYLKCMEEETKVQELKQLICEEIDHRNRFIYCKSSNSKKSYWVQEELNHLHETNRSYDVIHLDEQDDDYSQFVSQYHTDSLLFISCSRTDSDVAKQIVQRLKKFDKYRVFHDAQDLHSSIFANQIKDAIGLSCKCGKFICLLSTVENNWQRRELTFALEQGKEQNIIPILLNRVDKQILEQSPYDKIKNLNPIDVSAITPQKQPDVIVDKLLERLYSPGDILAMANQFRDEKKDGVEARKLYDIFFNLASGAQNPVALYAMAKCYELGYGINIDYQQAYNLYCECRAELGGNTQIGDNTLDECCQRVYKYLTTI